VIDDIPFLPEPTPWTDSSTGVPPVDIPGIVTGGTPGQPRIALARAEKIALQIQTALAPFCAKIEIAGSIRRKLATCGDIDLVVEPRDWMGEAHQALRARIKAKTTLITDGMQNLIVNLADGTQLDIFFARPSHRELFASVPGNFGSLLLCRTGSVAHNIKLVERAKQLNLRWQPYEGVYRPGSTKPGEGGGPALLASETETTIFTALNLPFISPEARQ